MMSRVCTDSHRRTALVMVGAVTLASARGTTAEAQGLPTVRVEQAAGSTGERTVVRAQLPFVWRLSASSEVRYVLAADAGERQGSTPALDQTLRFTRAPASARRGWALSTALRAGRVSALELALDTLALADVPGSLTTLTSLWRTTGTMSGSVRTPLGARASGIVSAQFDGTMGLGPERDLVPARQRSMLGVAWASRLSRNETRETRLSVVDERRPMVPPLRSIALATTWQVRPRRALTLRTTGGVQLARLAAMAGANGFTRAHPVGDAHVAWSSARRVQAALSLSTDIRLDGERALGRRQWSADVRGALPLSSDWQLTARARQAVLTGRGATQGTRTLELLTTSRAWPGSAVDFGVRVLQTDAPETVARSVTSTSLRDIRVFVSWTRSRR